MRVISVGVVDVRGVGVAPKCPATNCKDDCNDVVINGDGNLRCMLTEIHCTALNTTKIYKSN